MLITAIESGVRTPFVDSFREVTPAGTAAYKFVVEGNIEPKVKKLPFSFTSLRNTFILSLFAVASRNAGEKCTILIKALPVGLVDVAMFSNDVVVCFEHDHNRPLILATNIRIKDIFFFIVLIFYK